MSLRRHHWPGNVRELKNAVQAYAALGTSNLELPVAPQDPVAALQQFVDPEQPYALQKEQLLDAFMRVYLPGWRARPEFDWGALNDRL